MKTPKFIDIKSYIFIALGVISFSQFMVHLFGQTIPNIVLTFFKEAGAAVILVIVFLFAFAWVLKARPHNCLLNKSLNLDGLENCFL